MTKTKKPADGHANEPKPQRPTIRRSEQALCLGSFIGHYERCEALEDADNRCRSVFTPFRAHCVVHLTFCHAWSSLSH